MHFILNKNSYEGRDTLQNVSVESVYEQFTYEQFTYEQFTYEQFTYEQFSKLNEATPENNFDDINLENLPDFNTELSAPITVDEISKVILNLKNRKACSINDHILCEFLNILKMLCYPLIFSYLILL